MLRIKEMTEGKITSDKMYNTITDLKSSAEIIGYLNFLKENEAEDFEEIKKEIDALTEDDFAYAVRFINTTFDYSWYTLKAEIC